MASSKISRCSVRDQTLILMAYRQGLRVNDLLQLAWQDIDFTKARLNVRRVNNGFDTTHPIPGDKLRLLRQLKRSTEHVSATTPSSDSVRCDCAISTSCQLICCSTEFHETIARQTHPAGSCSYSTAHEEP